MDDQAPGNGAGNGKVYIKFGTHETDEMPKDWAEKMLTLWKDRQPNQFGKLLAEVAVMDRR